MNFKDFLNLTENFDLSDFLFFIKILFIFLNLVLLFFLIKTILKIKKDLPFYSFQVKKIKKFKKVPIIDKNVLKDYLEDAFKKIRSESIILNKIGFKELDNLILDLLNRLNIPGSNLKEKMINFSNLNNLDLNDYFKVEVIKNKVFNNFNYSLIEEDEISFIFDFYYNFLKKMNLINDKD